MKWRLFARPTQLFKKMQWWSMSITHVLHRLHVATILAHMLTATGSKLNPMESAFSWPRALEISPAVVGLWGLHVLAVCAIHAVVKSAHIHMRVWRRHVNVHGSWQRQR